MTERGALSSALVALRNQFVDFRFSYPLEFVPNSGKPQSLSYYLYGDRLSWDVLRLDEAGIAQAWFRMTGVRYWPGFVAWYGLVHLGHYLRTGEENELAIFLNQVSWLERHAVVRQDGSVVWTMNFDYPVCGVIQRAPWVSAHAQGFCISALVRAWRFTHKASLYNLLARSSRVFAQDHRAGGIRISLPQGALYTEAPGASPPGILDGFLTSLLGLYDLYIEIEDPSVYRLFHEGVTGLKAWLPHWDYRGKWSWYADRKYLCSPPYHCLNRLFLLALSEVTGDLTLAEYVRKWDASRLTPTLIRAIRRGFY
jgi:hypothetical protein